MNQVITADEYRRMAAKKKNKYHVAPKGERAFDGKTYASKAEAKYAAGLALALNSGNIIEYIEQPRLWLGVRLNIYVPDFLIITSTESYYVDIKGVETPAFKKVKQLWVEYGRLRLHIVKLSGTRFLTTETIHPK